MQSYYLKRKKELQKIKEASNTKRKTIDLIEADANDMIAESIYNSSMKYNTDDSIRISEDDFFKEKGY